ncbi:hypothetical protein EVAR_101260_1 [Eumeta japonica]|uniref:Uncharacterized protein n=1 Tax=Eumeta variegata TaxID=151549 RepID=A0A4C1SNN3_EUMVA|nr:hypothetical protein EVAR_101260_1 [Eumeta japonica]
MSDATLIDTLEFGSNEQKQKYEIYGDDAQTPTFAVISRQQGDGWQKLEEKSASRRMNSRKRRDQWATVPAIRCPIYAICLRKHGALVSGTGRSRVHNE